MVFIIFYFVASVLLTWVFISFTEAGLHTGLFGFWLVSNVINLTLVCFVFPCLCKIASKKK